MVAGVQWNADGTRIGGTKMNAALKHVFAYNAEAGRGSTNFNISAHDVQDTYLPSFEAPVVQSDAKGYMCAYSSVNGEPGCGNKFLKHTFRDEWNFTGCERLDTFARQGVWTLSVWSSITGSAATPGTRFCADDIARAVGKNGLVEHSSTPTHHGTTAAAKASVGRLTRPTHSLVLACARPITPDVVSDCGGVSDIKGYLKVNDSMAAAIALEDGGVDINCGGGLTNHICAAINESLVYATPRRAGSLTGLATFSCSWLSVNRISNGLPRRAPLSMYSPAPLH